MKTMNIINSWKGTPRYRKMKETAFTAFFIFLFSQSLMFLTACAEWDDHYDSDTSVLSTQGSSLWKNISSNESLSQFASLLKKTGYDAVLDASQTSTVWAPVNGSFDYEVLSSQRDERLLKEFVENHIARNNYPASGLVNERIYTLNEKLMLFSGSGSYVM